MIEGGWRLAVFVGVFALLAVLERAQPARARRRAVATRWLAHGVLGALAVAVPALLGLIARPLIGIGAAAWAGAAGVGLFNIVAVPQPVAALASILLLDLAIYLQHRAMHRAPFLWRFHAVHHHDHDLDVSSALRFHPGEILLSTLYKAAIIALIGAPVVAAAAYELILSTMALVNHANLALPPAVERWARWLIVTPTMHVRHHAVARDQHDRNFGNLLSIWDRVFGTWFREGPSPARFPIGLAETQAQPVDGIGWLLARPWR